MLLQKSLFDALKAYEESREYGVNSEEEVVARCCESFLSNPSFVNQMCRTNEKSARAIYKFIQEIRSDINALRSESYERNAALGYESDYSPETGILAQFGDIDRIAKLWEKGLREVSKKKASKSNAKSEGVRMSKPNEVLALKGVDWVGDKVSILNQLKEHKNEINKQPRVYSVEYVGETTNALINAIMEQVKQSGGESMKNGKVTFTFDRRGAEKIVEHADNEGLRAAAIIAPYVAKHGVLISGQKNHDNRGYPTLTFASPVYINGTEANVGVVIQFSRDGRPHAVGVEVDVENGSNKIKAEKGLGERSSVTKRSDSPTNSASKDSISSKAEYVKKSDTEYLDLAKKHDSDGNIIPLSERFKTDRTGEEAWKNDDIRYSKKDNIKLIPQEDNSRTFEMGKVTATVVGSDVELESGTLMNRNV